MEDCVFLPVGLCNLQLRSLGIGPVNIALELAQTVVSVQVLFPPDLIQFCFIFLNDEYVHAYLGTATNTQNVHAEVNKGAQ